jgi:hypothetical protein
MLNQKIRQIIVVLVDSQLNNLLKLWILSAERNAELQQIQHYEMMITRDRHIKSGLAVQQPVEGLAPPSTRVETILRKPQYEATCSADKSFSLKCKKSDGVGFW